MPFIYHITPALEWDNARNAGFYTAPSLASEGFIHCSTADQVAGVLHRYYQGATSLVQLTIDSEKLTSRVVYEPAPSATELFPHVYGPINCDAVVSIENVKV